MVTSNGSQQATLSDHQDRDKNIRPMYGFLAVERIKKTIRKHGHGGMAAISELLIYEPSLKGLERREILDQVLSYGGFHILETKGASYISLPLASSPPDPNTPLGIRVLFLEAVRLVEAEFSGRILKKIHLDDLVEDTGLDESSLIAAVQDELRQIQIHNGAVSRVLNLCVDALRTLGWQKDRWDIAISSVKGLVPGIDWMPPLLLACLLGLAEGVEVVITTGANRRIFVAKGHTRNRLVSPATVTRSPPPRPVARPPRTSPAHPHWTGRLRKHVGGRA